MVNCCKAFLALLALGLFAGFTSPKPELSTPNEASSDTPGWCALGSIDLDHDSIAWSSHELEWSNPADLVEDEKEPSTDEALPVERGTVVTALSWTTCWFALPTDDPGVSVSTGLARGPPATA
jgi:hypothetical protein